MNKKSAIFFVMIFLVSFVSAGVEIIQGPDTLYNLGDKIDLKINVIPNGEFNDLLSINLVCSQKEVEVYKEFLYLEAETQKEILIPLVLNFIGNSKGNCNFDYKIGDVSSTLTESFIISDEAEINLVNQDEPFTPGQLSEIRGTVIKENGEAAQGLIEIKIESENVFVEGEVVNGEFSLNLPISDDFPAGEHTLKTYFYEYDDEERVLNKAEYFSNILVKQVPTNIEIYVDNRELMPGESLRAKIILHDQTGEEMVSSAYVAIKDDNDVILEKIERNTGVFFEYAIPENQIPVTWTLAAYAEEIINRIDFRVMEKKQVSFELVNKTLIVTNVGNVFYNDSTSIQIGSEEVSFEVALGIGESEKFIVSAPKGEYEITAGDVSKTVSLTGNSIKIEKEGDSKFTFNKIYAWVFVIVILFFVLAMIFRKGYKRSFFGRRPKRSRKAVRVKEDLPRNSSGWIKPKTKTELALSIKGVKQNAVIGCLNLKNYSEIKSGQGNVLETLNNIVDFVESRKGLVYENNGKIFFILAPGRTKTFANELVGIDILEKIRKYLRAHNKKFVKKIDFGIGLNYGTIVMKEETSGVKFMTMGTLMTEVKKLSNNHDEEIYLGSKIKERLGKDIKTDLKEIGGITVHVFRELIDRTKHSTFLKGFVARQERERMKKEDK